MTPLVSVITIARNSVSSIEGAIESVISQSYRPLEYVVVDGASTDGTLEVIQRYSSRINRLISEQDNGIYDAMNKGLLASSGSHILFINSDDLFAHPDALRDLVNARLRDVEHVPTICYSDFIKHYPSLRKSMLMKADTQFERGFALCHQAMLVDRTAYEVVGLFDTAFRYAADHDWTVRAKRTGVRFLRAYIRPPVIFRHGGASNASYRLSRDEAGTVIAREYGRIAFIKYTVRQYWVRLLRTMSSKLEDIVGHRVLASIQLCYLKTVRGYRSHDKPSGQ
jgi:glycosyltransferase involved in cell wall biosynthesis